MKTNQTKYGRRALIRLANALAADALGIPDLDLTACEGDIEGAPGQVVQRRTATTRSDATDALFSAESSEGEFAASDYLQNLVAHWRGKLSLWHTLDLAIPEGALAPSGQVTYCRTKKAVTELFDSQTLSNELDWVAGELRLICARGDDGLIRSVSASVDRVPTGRFDGARVILELIDQAGSCVSLTLLPTRSSAVSQEVALVGELNDFELVVYSEQPQ